MMIRIAQSDLQLLMKALAFATHKHKDQRRKDPDASPYINHPVALANTLVNEGGITDIEIICAALLHDTVEDTETTPDELTEVFGPSITGIVMECTDNKSLPKATRKQAQIDHAKHMTTKAKAVKLADKISNLRDVSICPPADWSLERRQQYFDWAKQVVDRLRGQWPDMESVFDDVYRKRPHA